MAGRIVLLSLLPFLLLGLTGQAPPKPGVTVGFVVDGPWEENARILDLFRSELSTLLASDYRVTFPRAKTLIGDFSPASVHENLDALLGDPDVDVVLAMGLLASADAARRTDPPKPLIAPFVIASAAQGLPRRDGASGVTNLTYLESPSALGRELETFHDITPFTNLVLLTNRFFVEEMSRLIDNMTATASVLGLRMTVVPAAGSAESVLATIPPDAEAVYLAPLQQLDPGAFEPLVRALHERGLPTFALLGRWDVERGAFVGLASGDWFSRLARRVALDVQRILDGENAGDLPVDISRRDELVINMAAARELGVYPSYRTLTEAVLLNQTREDTGRTLSLLDTVREALQVNHDLLASDRDVTAGAKNVARARAALLPRIDAQALGLRIDRDRAASSFGAAPERSLLGKLSLTQLLWSEGAVANYSVQKNLQRSLEQEYARNRLDIARDAAVAYLDLLRAKTFEEIERENLKLSRSNLELAQIRRAVGVSGPAEVYRWQSRIAAEQKSAIQANAARNLAEMEVNRLLARPLEEPFTTTEPSLADPELVSSDPRLLAAFADPWTFRTFRRFMVAEALRNSPEMAGLDAAIAAQERAAASARNAFYSPTLALSGEISRRFTKGGTGTGDAGMSLPGFDPPDDTEWSLGLSLSLPLTDGGGRIAGLAQAREELAGLRVRRAALAERIEQRVRSALHLAGSSHAGIALARESAEAAARNLDLVQDAYSQGAVQIIDLLDAQNAALIAKQTAANAVYDFLLDLMEVERAMGRFTFLVAASEREAWFERMEAYFQEMGNQP